MNRIVFVVAIVAVLASACNHTNYEKEIKVIDSLFTIMEDSKALLATLDTAKVEEYQKNSTELLAKFDEGVEDTLDLETAVFVSDYAYVKKVLARFGKQKRDFENDFVFNNKQLNRLKNDLEHNAIPADSVEYYVVSETRAVKELNILVDKTVNNVNMQLERYDSLHPMVVNIAKELNLTVEAN